MKRFTFWYRWMLFASVSICVFGVLLVALSGTSALAILDQQVALVFWPNGTDPGVFAYHRWVHAVLGGTVAGWGVLLVFVTHYAFQQKEPWAWKAIVLAVGFWYLLDTTTSLVFLAYFNAILNTVLLILIVPPLVATWKVFR